MTEEGGGGGEEIKKNRLLPYVFRELRFDVIQPGKPADD